MSARAPSAPVTAGLVTVELVALTVLSQFPRPALMALVGAYSTAFFAYLALCARARRSTSPVWMWFAIAAAIRLPWLLTGLPLSDDAWRYLHDGRAQLAGVNPFQYPPASPEAATYAGPELPFINNPDLPTIYPPFAQLLFRVNAMFGATLASWKILLLAFDLGIGLALLGLLKRKRLPRSLVVVCLLHPLPVLEFAGNGHVDAVAICMMLLALAMSQRPGWCGAALAASVAAKYLAAPLVAFLVRPWRGRSSAILLASFGVVLLVVYLPFVNYLPVGSLGEFARGFEFNGPVYEALAALSTRVAARGVIGGILIILLARLWWRRVAPLDAAFWWVGALLLSSPIVHPWYVTWLIPFLCWRRDWWAWVWTGTVVFAYAVLPRWQSDGIWELPTWALVLEYTPVYLALAWQLGRRPGRLDSAATVGQRPPSEHHVENEDSPLFFFRRNKQAGNKGSADSTPRPMINGVVTVAGRAWTVREEKRQGAQAQAAQLLILEAADGSKSEMHLRPGPGREATTLEEVEPLAYDPLYRWVTDAEGTRWEVRMVVSDPPTRQLVKFVCWGAGVYEGAYPYDNGLGLRTDAELRDLLAELKRAPSS